MDGETDFECVSVPVVFGEYIRASGFFCRSDHGTFLMTAAHNLGATHQYDDYGDIVSTTYQLPEVDIFLPIADGWSATRIDITNDDGQIIQQDEIDVVAIEVGFVPEEFGVHVWTQQEFSDAEETGETICVRGYDGDCFPDYDQYNQKTYEKEIDEAVPIEAENIMLGEQERTASSDTLQKVGYALESSERVDYRGYSGAPVVRERSDGRFELAGVHVSDDGGRSKDVLRRVDADGGSESLRRLMRYRAPLLEQVLQSSSG